MWLTLLTLLACGQDRDGDGILDEVDCDPQDATIGLGVRVFQDADGDGYGQGAPAWACQVPSGMAEREGDCEDGDPQIHPGAPELCDGQDNDCSGDVDEDAVDRARWYPDFDGDGYGDGSKGMEACSAPEHYVSDAQDCDDSDSAVNPSADEVCNGLDDDCDGLPDGAEASDATAWYADADGDGYGDASHVTMACTQPADHAAEGTDCADSDPQIHPLQEEICDGVDNDCDGQVDFEGWLPGDYASLDQLIQEAPDGAHVCIASGRFAGSNYSTSKSLHLHGSGVDLTTLDAGGAPFLSASAEIELGLYDLELLDAAGGRDTITSGALAHLSQGGDLLLQRVRIQDPSCEATYACRGALVTWSEPGTLVATDVVIDGYTQVVPSGQLSGFFMGSYSTFQIDGMEITNSQVRGIDDFYSLVFYMLWGSAQVADLRITDNHIEAERYLGGMLYTYDAAGDQSFEDILIQDNTLYADAFSGTLGLFLYHSLATSTLRNLEIRDNALSCEASTLDGLAGALYAGEHDWQNLRVTGNRVEAERGGFMGGLLSTEEATLALSQADFADNSFSGLYWSYGGLTHSAGGRVDVRNTSSVNNDFDTAAPRAMLYAEDAGLTHGYNNLFASSGAPSWAEHDGGLVASPAYELDPLYADPSAGDYRLSTSSPLLDAGDPSIQDADGSPSDVGSYGGPFGEGG